MNKTMNIAKNKAKNKVAKRATAPTTIEPGTDSTLKSRPSWDEYFMDIASLIATRSTCSRRHVGAVIVRDKRLLVTGYNGAPRGLRHCGEKGAPCIRTMEKVPSGERQELCRGLHAEQNAIIQAALHGISLEGSALYSTFRPCSTCAKMLINAGIKHIIYKGEYPDPLAIALITEAKLVLEQFR
jgi:dCMP deaminase